MVTLSQAKTYYTPASEPPTESADKKEKKKEKKDKEQEEVYENVEEMAEFPGGEQALYMFLASNLRYPSDAQEQGAQGKVICQFVIEKNGSIKEVSVLKSIHPSLDKEAVRILKSMPKWKPGKQGGKPVRVRFTLPISFRMQSKRT